MVKITCPVCGGRGRVPDLSYVGPMAYYNPYGIPVPPHAGQVLCGQLSPVYRGK